MKKNFSRYLVMLWAVLFMLTGCSKSIWTGDMSAGSDMAASADWMHIDMSWIPSQDYHGVQVIEIRYQDRDTLEIGHVPITGNKTLDDSWIALIHQKMEDFEQSTPSFSGKKQQIIECAVTQGENNTLSVVFAEQNSLRISEGKPPLVTMTCYDKTTSQIVDPLGTYALTGEVKYALGKKMIRNLVASGILQGDEDWLTQSLLEEGQRLGESVGHWWAGGTLII